MICRTCYPPSFRASSGCAQNSYARASGRLQPHPATLHTSWVTQCAAIWKGYSIRSGTRTAGLGAVPLATADHCGTNMRRELRRLQVRVQIRERHRISHPADQQQHIPLHIIGCACEEVSEPRHQVARRELERSGSIDCPLPDRVGLEAFLAPSIPRVVHAAQAPQLFSEKEEKEGQMLLGAGNCVCTHVQEVKS